MEKKKSKDKEIKKLKREIKEMKDGWQRTQADFENYRKRTADEINQREMNGRLQVILDLMPVFDNFDRAYKHIPDEDKEKNWVQGIIAIEKQFHSILNNMGIEKYHVAGKKFDPSLAEAAISAKSNKPEGTIIEELEPGYKMGEKIIRYARVKVSKGKFKA
ncbi:MAG: nucleotide exchange factor GrpE [Candidatus Berkelbacteria bacterium]|nr:nucleotide exchange factor GrpE [Candidatus Berkelbacteria bacterium]